MKKFLSLLAMVAVVGFGLSKLPSTLAKPDKAQGPKEKEISWELTAPQSIDFTCGGNYSHTLLTVSNNDPSVNQFTGTGHYNSNNLYTWNIEGMISGNSISFTLIYTGANPGYTLHGIGTIAEDGSISGTVDGNCSAFSMGPGSAVVEEEHAVGPAPKVDVCHRTEGTNEYLLLNVSENSLASHQAHGDYLPGDDYPGNEEMKFAEECSVVEKEWTLLETVEVPANRATDTTSNNSLVLDTSYILKVRGSAMACNQPGCVISFDADYSTSDNGTTWVDGVAAPYAVYGVNLLDLMVDSGFVDWGTFDISHEYTLPYVGTGNPLGLFINDLAGSHTNNSGSLFVDIYQMQ